MRPRVSSVTVAFNPPMPRLLEQMRAIAGQVDEIVIVDNGSQPAVERLLAEHAATQPRLRDIPMRIVTLAENAGIAKGLNAGIDAAREGGASFVVLLDHDSIPAGDMVARLAEAHERCAARPGAPPVAAIGPRVRDPRDSRDYPFVSLGWLRNRHHRCEGALDDVIACDFLISSGTLIALDTLAKIGAFEEDLFIDSVDREWCFRARARGCAIYGACAARLDHRLGDRRRVFDGLELIVHSPLRLYYMTRNRLLLYGRAYVPLKWKLKDFLRLLAKFAATLLFVSPRREYARMSYWAVRDALARRGGKFGRDES